MKRKRLITICVSICLIAGILGFLFYLLLRSSDHLPVIRGMRDDVQYSNELYPSAKEAIELNAAEAFLGNGGLLTNSLEGIESVAVLAEEAWAEWTFTVPNKASYQLYLDYYPITGRLTDIELSVSVDDKDPWSKNEQYGVSRAWKLEHAVTRDNQGNDIRPGQIEDPKWMSLYLQDDDSYVTRYLTLQLDEGEHVLRLSMTKDSLALKSLTLKMPDPLPDYAQTLAAHPDSERIEDYLFKREAEDFYNTSSASIYASNDRGNASISPSDPAKVRLNVMGLDNWNRAGQWISWKITVPQDGWYHIYLKYRQNAVKGFSTARRLYIDGVVPFAEAERLIFPYTSGQDWLQLPIGGENDEPFEFFLTAGEHEIKLEVISAPSGELLEELAQIIEDLNSLYRKIIMVTGTSPDALRDYYLDQEIPDLLPSLGNEADRIDALLSRFEKLSSDGDTTQVAFLKEASSQLRSLQKKPETIQTRLSDFRSSITTMADLILSLQYQPLELDYITITGKNTLEADVNAGLFKKAEYRFKSFTSSFTEDYNAIGNTYEAGEESKPLNVWVVGNASGRDQLTVCKSLIDNIFTPQYGIQVNINLVDSTTTLIQAILAGSAPDCALMVPSDEPINLAMRNALVDVSKLDGFDEVKSWYYDSALIPYEFEGGVYGMPETQSYWMLFYRTDILQELEVDVPDTWDDFYAAANIIMKSNLRVGVPENLQMFETFLMQNGAELYIDDCTRTRLDEQSALAAFTEWTNLYVNYGFDMEFDALSRFRTGEMPIILHPYTFYNQLTVAAPEISGLWSMAPMPARMLNGEMTRATSSSGTGSIIIKDTDQLENCWIFLQWWCSEEAQAAYGTQIEAVLGHSARYAPANKNAFEKIGWSAVEKRNLISQWAQTNAFYNVPGKYYVSRCLTNAFRRVTIYYDNPRETLAKYNQQINTEITRKRADLGLNTVIGNGE